jgi:hypothetical protein
MSEIADLILRYSYTALVLTVILGPVLYFQGRAVLRRHRRIRQHRAEGTIGPAALLQGDELPLHYDALARLGTKGEAPRTVDDRVLRPSAGVRLLVLGLALSLGSFLFWPGLAPAGFDEALQELPVSPNVVRWLLLLVLVNAVLYIFGFEARYNRDQLIITRMLVVRRVYRWRDLTWIGDDGAYDLVLRFDPGGKAKVLKHSRGIAEFKRFAQAVLAQHGIAHARTARG